VGGCVHKLLELVVVERHAVADDLHQCPTAVVTVDAAKFVSALAHDIAGVPSAPVADEALDRGLLDGAVVLLHVLEEIAAVFLVGGAALIGDEDSALTLERHWPTVAGCVKVAGGGGGGGRRRVEKGSVCGCLKRSARRGKRRRQVSVVEWCTAAVGGESRWLACCQVADDQGDADGEWNGDVLTGMLMMQMVVVVMTMMSTALLSS
jgi:hypothetical protein